MSEYNLHFISELKHKVTLSDLIKPAIQSWDRIKSNPARQDWWAPCPFHNEKTSSFHVDDRKGFYHCFGCQAHGSAVDWLMNYNNFTFPQTITHLCELTNTPKPNFFQHPQNNTSKNLFDITKSALDYFKEALELPKNLFAQEYLVSKRMLTSNTINQFKIGFAPDVRYGLFRYLTKQGFNVKDCIKSGLIIQPDDNSEPFDRFRNRIMFPVFNTQGNIVTFGGRTLSKTVQAKYINGPETEIFKKSTLLYNLNFALKGFTSLKNIIVAEGYMDVIALSQSGFPHCVAPMGTALTIDQIQLLWKYTPEPILCFDGDKAGLNAARRIAHNLLTILKPGFSVDFSFLPDGLDPDDFLRTKSVDAFDQLVKKPIPLSAVLFADKIEHITPDTPERKAGLEKELSNLAHSIQDPRLRSLYYEEFKNRLKNFLYTYKKNLYSYNTTRQNSFNQQPSFYKDTLNISRSSDSLSLMRQHKTKNDSLDHIEQLILGFYIQFLQYLSTDFIHKFSDLSFEDIEKKQLQSEILNIFVKNKINSLENKQEIHTMRQNVQQLDQDNLWQVSQHVCQTDLYKNCLSAVSSLNAALTRTSQSYNDFNNLITRICHGMYDMYHKIYMEKTTFQMGETLSHKASEEDILKFITMKYTTLNTQVS